MSCCTAQCPRTGRTTHVQGNAPTHTAKPLFCYPTAGRNAVGTLLTASRKSFSVTVFLRARMAYMPASVHTLRMSAPVALGHNLARAHRPSGLAATRVLLHMLLDTTTMAAR